MKFLKVLLPACLLLASCGSCEKDEALVPPAGDQQDSLKVISQGSESPVDTLSLQKDTLAGKKPRESWEIYGLPQGEHYNDLRRFAIFTGDELRFNFKFDSTAIYQTSDPRNQADWNKLMGFSDCGSLHQTNSIRLVWRWYQGELQIGEYRYQEGEREFSTLTSVDLGRANTASIQAADGEYRIRVNEQKVTRPRYCDSRTPSYWLFPYFGGDESAPHIVNISVKHLQPKF